MTDSEYREMLNHHQQLLNQQVRDQMMRAYPDPSDPSSTAYREYLKAQQAAMMNSALNTQFGQAKTAPARHISVGGTKLHEKDVRELHNLIEFMKFATEASEEMKALWTAFVVARKLEG
jgi:hypothetical protein